MIGAEMRQVHHHLSEQCEYCELDCARSVATSITRTSSRSGHRAPSLRRERFSTPVCELDEARPDFLEVALAKSKYLGTKLLQVDK